MGVCLYCILIVFGCSVFVCVAEFYTRSFSQVLLAPVALLFTLRKPHTLAQRNRKLKQPLYDFSAARNRNKRNRTYGNQ